jgi:hypothetical protein
MKNMTRHRKLTTTGQNMTEADGFYMALPAKGHVRSTGSPFAAHFHLHVVLAHIVFVLRMQLVALDL